MGNCIRGLILDYGEVLCHRPGPEKIGRMAEAIGLVPEEFAARYGEERGPYDRGDLSPAEYWARVSRGGRPLDPGVVRQLREWDVEMWSDLNAEMTAWLDALHAAGLKTALLSNMHADMAQHARANFGWLRSLDHVVLSCEVRLIKPDRAIYQRCVEGLGLRPQEACFIDDREVNVAAARAAGLTALRFQGTETLRADLIEIGLPVLPRAGSCVGPGAGLRIHQSCPRPPGSSA